MSKKEKRYPGVEGKTVEFISTNHDGDMLFVHIRFTDKTFLSISVASGVRVHSADLYAESSGDYEVLRDYINGTRPRKKAGK